MITEAHHDQVIAVARHSEVEKTASKTRLTRSHLEASVQFTPTATLTTLLEKLESLKFDISVRVVPEVVVASGSGHTTVSQVVYV